MDCKIITFLVLCLNFIIGNMGAISVYLKHVDVTLWRWFSYRWSFGSKTIRHRCIPLGKAQWSWHLMISLLLAGIIFLNWFFDVMQYLVVLKPARIPICVFTSLSETWEQTGRILLFLLQVYMSSVEFTNENCCSLCTWNRYTHGTWLFLL